LTILGNILFGVIQIGLGLPLAMRKVPKNCIYGIRTKAAFESDKRWFDINAYAGRQMIMWSVILFSNGVTGFFIPAAASDAYVAVSLAIAALVALGPIIMTGFWSRKTAGK
jgi:hypothetical protein